MKKLIDTLPADQTDEERIAEIKSRHSHTREDFDFLGTYYIHLLSIKQPTIEEKKEKELIADLLDVLKEKLMPF